jgi:hypothetical protein
MSCSVQLRRPVRLRDRGSVLVVRRTISDPGFTPYRIAIHPARAFDTQVDAPMIPRKWTEATFRCYKYWLRPSESCRYGAQHQDTPQYRLSSAFLGESTTPPMMAVKMV